jgi:hypothetical protein
MSTEFKYDVAISFAEEDRDAAKSLSLELVHCGLSVYYYPDQSAATLGRPLDDTLRAIYRDEARYAVVLFSENYLDPEKQYTIIELEAIRYRMQLEPDKVYMLPVKLNESVSLAAVRELLGKEVVDAESNPGIGQVVFGTVDGKVQVIANSNIDLIDQRIISNTSVENVIIYQNIENTEAFRKPTDTDLICPHCYSVLDGSKKGRIICTNPECGKIIWNIQKDSLARVHIHVSPEEGTAYNKIIAHIRNKTIDRDYKAALQFCREAELIAPNELATWENFALTQFLYECYQSRGERKSVAAIIKSVRAHVEKCKHCGITDEAYFELVGNIADQLFYFERSHIRSQRAQARDHAGYEKWTRQNLQYIQQLLQSYELCFSLYKDTVYLEEYILELARPNKWIEKIAADDSLVNTRACGSFNAKEKFKMLVARVKEVKPLYKPPEIAYQRIFLTIIEEEEPHEENEKDNESSKQNLPDPGNSPEQKGFQYTVIE